MSTNVFKMLDGERIELTESENKQRLADDAVAQDARDARAWLDGRLSEYPPLQDQIDMQYWDGINGTTLWSDMITEIKNKYPKGE